MNKVDFSYTILEKMLTLKPFKNREEAINAGRKMVEIAKSKEECDKNLQEAYDDAFEKLQSIESFEEMQKLISVLS